MPPIPVPRAAAMLVPIRSVATTARFCLFVFGGKVPFVGRLFVLSLLL